jgi:hypothetical protein
MTSVDFLRASHFWTKFFEQEKLAWKLDKLISEEEHSFKLSNYGKLKLKVVAATAFGDGFLSDTCALTATVESGATFTAFVKVRFVMKCLYVNFSLINLLTDATQ